MTKHLLLTGMLGAAILAGVGPVLAQNHEGKHGMRLNFEDVDSNADGQLSKQEMADHHKARFLRFDANGDGLISAEEMRGKMRQESNAKIDARIAKMMQRHDADGNGLISDDEILPQRADRMFRHVDTDADGMISRAEFDEMQKMRADRKKNKS